MENSPKIGVKKLIHDLLGTAQAILEMQIAAGSVAVVFPSGYTRLDASQILFVGVVASVVLFCIVFLKGEFE